MIILLYDYYKKFEKTTTTMPLVVCLVFAFEFYVIFSMWSHFYFPLRKYINIFLNGFPKKWKAKHKNDSKNTKIVSMKKEMYGSLG